MPSKINTYNESSLHNTLKIMYSVNHNGQTEIEQDGYIFDVIGEDGTIIEIQTKTLSKLYPKLSSVLEKNKKVILVHPIAARKQILTRDSEQKLLSLRKSPKKESVYSIFKELTKLYPILLHPNFQLDIIEASIIEERVKLDELVQSKNKRRRFRKNWLPVNKTLEDILDTKSFSSKEDYLKLLPDDLPELFSSKDIQDFFKKSDISGKAKDNAALLLWVYSRMGIIEHKATEKRLKLYSIVK